MTLESLFSKAYTSRPPSIGHNAHANAPSIAGEGRTGAYIRDRLIQVLPAPEFDYIK